MDDQRTWKILFFVCGDASDRLAPGQGGIDLGPLLALDGLPAGPAEAIVLVQARLGTKQPALRLAQLPGETLAAPAASVDDASDSPAARDAFVAWALRHYPTRHTLLVLRNCQAESNDESPEPAFVFSVTGPTEAPHYWPLSEAGLGDMADQFATRGLGSWLSSLARSLSAHLSGWLSRPQPEPSEPTIPKETPPMNTEREWTILLYMAGDNGKTFEGKYGKFSLMAQMTGVGIDDLMEAEQVGTTDQVAVLAQFDTLPTKDTLAGEVGAEAGSTYRLEVHKGRSVIENIVEVMPDVNTGDPAELARFIVWGMNRCPAKRTMLVLWNHGLGWKDDDIYAKVRGMSRKVAQGMPTREHNTAMFLSTARTISRRASRTRNPHTRAILCDDTSMDFLTNVEMSQALRVAEFARDEADALSIFSDKERLEQLMGWGNEGALRHLSIIGMDACLMAMIEVQYQVRQFADVMVASQEVEPLKGWPYDTILADLAARPTMEARELSTLIVDRFVESYVADTRRQPDVTQSAIDLSRLGEAAGLLKAFASSLGKEFRDDGALERAYKDARDKAPRDGYAFEDPEYVDLVSLLDAMIQGYRGDRSASKTIEAAAALQAWLQSDRSPVLRNSVTGKFDGKAHGISIYTPRDLPSPLYKEIDFHSAGWYNTVKKIYEA
jgi:hypothetical protein